MTYARYEEIFRQSMKEYCYGTDEQIEAYTNLMIDHNCVRNQYIEDVKLSKMLGEDMVNPDALAMNAGDLTPEYWPMEEISDKTVFEGTMNFKSVHKK